MTVCISDFDYFSMAVTIFLLPSFDGVLSYIVLISQLNDTFTKLPFTIYRAKIAGIGHYGYFHLCGGGGGEGESPLIHY